MYFSKALTPSFLFHFLLSEELELRFHHLFIDLLVSSIHSLCEQDLAPQLQSTEPVPHPPPPSNRSTHTQAWRKHGVVATLLEGTVDGVTCVEVLVALDDFEWHFVCSIFLRRAYAGQPLHEGLLADRGRRRFLIGWGPILIVVLGFRLGCLLLLCGLSGFGLGGAGWFGQGCWLW